MEFLRENFEIIVLILFIITIALIFSVLSINKYFAMYFSNKKFLINSVFEIDAANGHKDFSITVYNKNINDIESLVSDMYTKDITLIFIRVSYKTMDYPNIKRL